MDLLVRLSDALGVSVDDTVLCLVCLQLLTCVFSFYNSGIVEAPFTQLQVSLKLFMWLALQLHKVCVFTETAHCETALLLPSNLSGHEVQNTDHHLLLLIITISLLSSH